MATADMLKDVSVFCSGSSGNSQVTTSTLFITMILFHINVKDIWIY